MFMCLQSSHFCRLSLVEVFYVAGPLAMHIKHAHPSFSRGSQSVEAMWPKKMTPEQQAEHNRRLLDRARDVEVAFVAKDIVATALAAIVEQDLPLPAWLPKSCVGRK